RRRQALEAIGDPLPHLDLARREICDQALVLGCRGGGRRGEGRRRRDRRDAPGAHHRDCRHCPASHDPPPPDQLPSANFASSEIISGNKGGSKTIVGWTFSSLE